MAANTPPMKKPSWSKANVRKVIFMLAWSGIGSRVALAAFRAVDKGNEPHALDAKFVFVWPRRFLPNVGVVVLEFTTTGAFPEIQIYLCSFDNFHGVILLIYG